MTHNYTSKYLVSKAILKLISKAMKNMCYIVCSVGKAQMF